MGDGPLAMMGLMAIYTNMHLLLLSWSGEWWLQEAGVVRGDTPHPRSGAGAVRRYPISKVRETPVKRVDTERGSQRADR